MLAVIDSLLNIWKHRILIYTLIGRDLKARYRGSVLGFMWSFLNPLLMMLVYALVFQYWLRFDMKGYAAYLCTGLLPWIWFSSGILEGSRSIIVGSNLVNKALFPAEILPIVSVFTNMVNFLLSLPMLLIIMHFYGIPVFNPYMLLLIFPMIVQIFFMLAVVMFLSTMSVYFRDVEQILANIMNLLFFLIPIIYPRDIEILKQYPLLIKANPIAMIIMSYQDIFYFGTLFAYKRLLVIGLCSVIMFLIGYAVFNRHKDNFPEEV